MVEPLTHLEVDHEGNRVLELLWQFFRLIEHADHSIDLYLKLTKLLHEFSYFHMIHLNVLHAELLNSELFEDLLGAGVPLFGQLGTRYVNLLLHLRFVLLALIQFEVLREELGINFLLKLRQDILSVLCRSVKRLTNVHIILVAPLRDLKELVDLVPVLVDPLLQYVELVLHHLRHNISLQIHVLHTLAELLHITAIIIDSILEPKCNSGVRLLLL